MFQSFLGSHVEYYGFILWGPFKRIDLSINQFFKYFCEIRKGTKKAVVAFVYRITFFKNWSKTSILQNIREISTLNTSLKIFLRE